MRHALAVLFLAACSHTAPETPAPVSHPVPTGPSPVLSVLDQFTAADVPALGPAENGPTARNWNDPVAHPAWPGRGLAEHPMLFAGEGYNTLFLINEGKLLWTYGAGRGGEIDDVWLLSNGHVLFARQRTVVEVTPKKEVVFEWPAPEGTEIHTVQPIGLDKVLMIQNGLPPKLLIVDKKSRKIEREQVLPAVSQTDPKTVHPQFRRVRMTADGTFLAPFLKMGKVIEYDASFKPIWTYEIPTPWAAVRLHNGNTLIADEHDKLVREVNRKGETVWQLSQADLPPNIVLHNVQTVDRLVNGNTVIFCSVGGVKREERTTAIQAVEVTPDKKVAWVLQDWNILGPATTAQFLDQPGVPEKPGDLQH